MKKLNHMVRFSIVPILTGFVLSCGGSQSEIDPWDKVQKILEESKDTVVLDGIEKTSLKYSGVEEPKFGDWIVRHALSDPENFNT